MSEAFLRFAGLSAGVSVWEEGTPGQGSMAVDRAGIRPAAENEPACPGMLSGLHPWFIQDSGRGLCFRPPSSACTPVKCLHACQALAHPSSACTLVKDSHLHQMVGPPSRAAFLIGVCADKKNLYVDEKFVCFERFLAIAWRFCAFCMVVEI